MKTLPLTSVATLLIILTSCTNSQSNNQANPEVKNSSPTPSQTTTKQEDKDVEYMTTLGLMKGHLIVAKELLNEGKPEQAEPHLGHPVAELYGDIESQLPERKVPEFKNTLNQLHELVKSSPNNPKIKTNYQEAMAAIDTAIEAIPPTKRQSPQLILPVINGLLQTAAEEYEAAIAKGKIAETIEYQDSRGFVLYADILYQQIAKSLQQQQPDKNQKLAANFQEIKKVYPSVTPPTAPVLTPEQMSQLVQQIRVISHY
jgi:tetratricopeptide (TPR) repeat protein